MYAVGSLPQLLAALPQVQQLHAAVLADMWQMQTVCQAAVQMLVEATEQDALDEDAFGHFCGLQAHPNCLTPLFRAVATITAPERRFRLGRVLLAVLGNLEAVWADGNLQALLLSLPLHAMELLLSPYRLKVGMRWYAARVCSPHI
jgi:hypothetical protein